MKRYMHICSLLALLSSPAFAECKIEDFAIKDYTNFSSDSRVSLALLTLVTREQYELIKNSIWTSGSYAEIFKGAVDYDDFKQRLNKELAYSSFNYDLQTATRYVSQHLSAGAIELYSQCMEKDAAVLGLRLWLARRDGPYYNLKAIWVNGPAEPPGKFTGKIEDGVTAISDVPQEWPRAIVKEILVKKSAPNNQAGAFVLKVNDTSVPFVVVPDPIIQEYDYIPTSIAPIGTASGGNWSSGRKEASTCAVPPPGTTWVRGQAKINQFYTSEASRGGSEIMSQDEYSICWKVWISTSAEEHAETVKGGILALARRPKAPMAPPTPVPVQSAEAAPFAAPSNLTSPFSETMSLDSMIAK